MRGFAPPPLRGAPSRPAQRGVGLPPASPRGGAQPGRRTRDHARQEDRALHGRVRVELAERGAHLRERRLVGDDQDRHRLLVDVAAPALDDRRDRDAVAADHAGDRREHAGAIEGRDAQVERAPGLAGRAEPERHLPADARAAGRHARTAPERMSRAAETTSAITALPVGARPRRGRSRATGRGCRPRGRRR